MHLVKERNILPAVHHRSSPKIEESADYGKVEKGGEKSPRTENLKARGNLSWKEKTRSRGNARREERFSRQKFLRGSQLEALHNAQLSG